jgi:hypothetical protein
MEILFLASVRNRKIKGVFIKNTKKIVYVILPNKIVGIDSIMPLCMEMHGRCGYRFNFIFLDFEAHEFITKNNIVLADAINHIGKVDFVSSSRLKSRYISKLFFIFYFLKVIFNVAIKNNYVVHSQHFHAKPLMWIRWLFKKSNVIFIEKKSFGLRSEKNFSDIRNHNLKLVYSTRLTYSEISKYNIDIYSHLPLLHAGRLIGYDDEWNYFKHPKASKLKKIVLKDVRKNKYWIDFINNYTVNYFNRENHSKYLEDNNIITFIATRITRTDDSYLINEFVGALKALSKYIHTFPLYIKLHIFSDVEFINELIDISLGANNRNVYTITTLHPMVLATKSLVSVFANEGTVMGEFSALGVPVVNLQIYEDILPPSYLDSAIKLDDSELIRRNKARKDGSDCTFTSAKDFDGFMENLVNSLSSLSGTRTISSSSKDLGLCDFLKQ